MEERKGAQSTINSFLQVLALTMSIRGHTLNLQKLLIMTKLQETLLDRLEGIAMQLMHTDKEDKAKGELNDLQRAIREIRQALQK